MKKVFLLSFLIVGLGLSAQTVESNTEKNILIEDVVTNGKHEIKKQKYLEDGTLCSYVISRTNLARGTYIDYHKNGKLKTFKIVN